ncbi:MAG TPA: hypothetical protein VGT78_14035 [Rhizomicrobium sp.]|nr:hypothetical protein [Rhizomicrobium sp.]
MGIRAWAGVILAVLSMTIAGSAAAAKSHGAKLHGIEGVLANLPGGVLNGFVCSAHPQLFVAPYASCLTPIGIGVVSEQWSNGKYMYAMVNDPNGDTLCIAGPVSELSQTVKIAPMPADIAQLVTLVCMRKFGQVAPVPKMVLAVWY